MNTRKQKIWLVSMLGLMVVLSAYYLFTEDTDRMTDANVMPNNELTAVEDLGATYDSQFTNEGGLVLSDEALLAEVESMQANAQVMDQFDSLHYTRDQHWKEKFNEFNRVITDPSQTTEATSQAYTELHTLEEQFEILQSLEERLMQDYGNAVITPEENGKYHVRVMAEELGKSQAVSIIESVAQELGVQSREVYVTMMN